MVVNDKYRFVFIHIPKSAGTSIQTALKEVEGLNRRAPRGAGTKHETVNELMARWGLQSDSMMPSKKASIPLSDYLFFCFVRNPWARLCSLHRYLCQIGVVENVPTDVNDFVKLIADEDPSVTSLRSIRPQSDFVTNHVGFVGRYENLAEDFAAVMRQLTLEIALPHENSSGSFRHNHRDLLSDESAEVIARIYRTDVERFGYQY